MERGLLIGIDGGGTHSTAVAARKGGQIVAVAYGEGMNFHNVGVMVVRQRMEALVEQLQAQCGGESVDKVCVGMSALDYPADEATLERFVGRLSRSQLDLQSDAYIALMGFTLGKPGVIAICGTGSMLLRVDGQGRQRVSGGWGYLLGDAGSGYSLARDGLQAVMDQSEGLGPDTPLTGDALAYFRIESPRQLIDRIYAPGFTPDQLAGFARWVLMRAAEGDVPSLALLERNMTRLARQTAELIRQAPEAARVGLYGGIFQHSNLARSIFIRALQSQVDAEASLLQCPPELGAVIHLMKEQHILEQDKLLLMKNSYKELCHERH